jgi:L-ascorbate metabolism protein UlaG (beta-lactamase superfamily)
MKILIIILIAALAEVLPASEPEQNQNKEQRRMQLKSVKEKNKYKNYAKFSMMGDGSPWSMLKEWMCEKTVREPEERLEYKRLKADSIFTGSDSCLRATPLGHSSFIIELDGLRILLDPVLSNNISPVRIYSVKRFQKRAPITADSLPQVDVAIISHDHYDHLDKKTIKKIHKKVKHFIVPKGVEKYLLKWDVPKKKIVSLDWSESFETGKHTITALPSQHFSGRGVGGGSKTLWASFAIVGPHHKLYFSGDTGYHSEFKRIGELYGPFDLVILDTGQYGKHWPQVHMFPHEAVKAFLELKGKNYIPAHWGSFNLSTHNWYDPIEGAIKSCEEKGVNYAIPYPGEAVVVGEELPRRKWWNGK